MLKKAINFIKYNNAALLILLAIFAVGSSVWAQTETGQEFIGEKQDKIDGIDNTLLLDVDLENYDMDFKIEKVTRNDKYYFVTYTYLDLVKTDDAWEYLLNEKIRKVSLKIKKDLGVYLAEELKEEYDARVKILKQEQKTALEKGEEIRTEVAGYSGLIGKTLKLSEKIFLGYESVKEREIPSPTIPATVLAKREIKASASGIADNLTYIARQAAEKVKNTDTDVDGVGNGVDNCPFIYNINQKDTDDDGIGDVCDSTPNGNESEVNSENNDGGVDIDLEIIIDSHPDVTTTAATAIFTFYLNPANASSTFQCQIDSEDWVNCDSPIEYADLAISNHSFAVKTETDNGFILADFSWEIVKEDVCGIDNLNLCDEIGCVSLGENYIWEYEECIASTTSE